MNNDWKDRLGIVFSTSSDFKYNNPDEQKTNTLPPQQQKLHVYFERRNRNGKVVTLIDGFIGSSNDLKCLEKLLKTKCGTGGSSKEGQIIIQGNCVDKIKSILDNEGYKVK